MAVGAAKKFTREELVAAGLTEEQIALFEGKGAIKAEPKGKIPLASMVNYTNQNGETNTFLRLSLNGSEFGSTLVRVNKGADLTEEGRNKVIEIANALGDLLNTDMIPVKHGKK